MADVTERLLLQVDAATELLRRHLTEAEQPLDRFERRADRMADNVDRSIGRMGSKFGTFASLADDAAKRAQASFEGSFSQVQRIAAQAIKGPTVDGRANLGVEELRSQAAAAQDQARAFALIAEAAQRAAASTGDTAQATHLFIQASNASRIEAESQAASLLAEAGALERVQIELMQSSQAVELFVGRHQQMALVAQQDREAAAATSLLATEQDRLARGAAMLRSAMDPTYALQQRFNQQLDLADDLFRAGVFRAREYEQALQFIRGQLQSGVGAITNHDQATNRLAASQGGLRQALVGVSYQTQDVITQWSMGANVLQAFAIQAAQLGGQFAMLNPEAGKAEARLAAIGNFMVGVPGLVLTAALAFSPLISKMLDMDDAAKKAADSLKKNAEEAETAATAKALFARTEAGAIADVRSLTEEIRQQNDALRTNAERLNIRAKLRLQTLDERRADVSSDLTAARARRDAAMRSTSEGSAIGVTRANDEIRELEASLKRIDAAIAKANAARLETQRDLSAEAGQRAADPIAKINRKYDGPQGLIEMAKRRATAEQVVSGALTKQIEQLETARQLELKTERDRQSAAQRSHSANRQFGRDVDEAGARSIIASIGGRVTSGTRSRAEQARIYADAQAGRHVGPVARPGTSAHERGQALDVAYGPGISVASIRKAFEDAGVRLRKVLNEPTQRVYHVEWGQAPRRGPSAETMQRRQDAAKRAVLADNTAFSTDFLGARKRLLEATGRSASTEEQRDALLREEINAEADAQRTRTGNRLQSGDLTVAQALQLHAVNEATRQQRLANVDADKARRLIEQRYDSVADAESSRLDVLRIQQDSAVTERDRQRIGREILELEQQLRRQALERVAATSDDPQAVQRAKDSLARLPEVEKAENGRFEQQTAGPLDRYRQRVMEVSKDTKTALESIAVQGFGKLEDEGSRATAQAVTDLLGLKGAAADVVGSVIQDLARLAIQKAIVGAIGGSFFGFADGGSLADIAGRADGGSLGGLIQGPGTGRSDSILALLGGKGGAVRLSNREFIVNAAATKEWLPELAAINSGRLRKFADGGALSLSAPSMPSLREPRPNMARLRGAARDRVDVQARFRVEPSPLLMAQVEETTIRTVAASADPIAARASDATMRRMSRPRLPGAFD